MLRASTTPSRGGGARRGRACGCTPTAAGSCRTPTPTGARWCSAAAPRCTTPRWRPRGWGGRSRWSVARTRTTPTCWPRSTSPRGALSPRPRSGSKRCRPAAPTAAGSPRGRSRPNDWTGSPSRPPSGERWSSPSSTPACACTSTRSSAAPTRSSAATRSTPPRPRPGSRVEGPEGVPAASIPEVNPHRPAMPSRYHAGRACPTPRASRPSSSTGWWRCARSRTTRCPGCGAGRRSARCGSPPIQQGLSLLPLSQVAEVPETREELRGSVLGGTAWPQLLVRLGWQEMTRE